MSDPQVKAQEPQLEKREGQTGLGASKRDQHVKFEESQGIIEFQVVRNDKSLDSMRKLIDLKNIVAKQLPRMPRPYIVRLIMDRVHEAMIILRKAPNQKPVILGGCVFRPFREQKFAEIVFLAVTTSEQVKGYGTRLMNKLKDHAAESDIHYFLTYADNNAIEYFRKQGFQKQPTPPRFMPETRWKGFIKDYNGSTMMQCIVQQGIRHETLYQDIRAQRDAIVRMAVDARFMNLRKYPGLDFSDQDKIVVPGGKPKYTFAEVPGVVEAGWTEGSYVASAMADQRSFEEQCNEVISYLVGHENSWPFRKPVDTKKVRDYTDVITHPMDLETIAKKVDLRTSPSAQNGGAAADIKPYQTMEEFKADIKLMFENARIYNQAETIYYKYAWQLESLVQPFLKRLRDETAMS